MDALKDVGTLRSYYEESFKTAVYPEAGTGSPLEIAYLGLGLAGESGEAVDVLKKLVRMGPSTSGEEAAIIAKMELKLFDEIGDVMWYIGQIMRVYDLELDDILANNVEKLKRRYVTGEVKNR